MRVLRNSLLFCLLLSCTVSSLARPKIGLALSGGGAKGAAHLGVIQLLEQYHIPIDYVAGTSMGAYFGAMLAMGYSAQEIEQRSFALNWESGFVDEVTRSELSLRSKKQQDNFQVPLPFGLNQQGLQMPQGAVQGQTMAQILRDASDNLEALASFDQLAIPFRAVATDMATMQPYILSRGDIAVAMQASMSVPGVLRPVELEGKLLADGGVVNNLPVDVLQEMGADIIIAVDIGDHLQTKQQLSTAVAMVDQLSTFLTRSGTERQIALLGADDLLISPNMSGIATADFALMPLAVERGKQAARSGIEQLAKRLKLASHSDGYASYQQQLAERRAQLKLHQRFLVSRVELNNHSGLSDQVILARLQLQPGELLSKADLEQRIGQLYALGTFERVDYRISSEPGGNVIHLDTREKSWGPGYFDLKFALQENFTERTEVNLGLGFTLSNLNHLGAEWRSELEIGAFKRLFSEFYTPMSANLRYSWGISAEYEKRSRRLYEAVEGAQYLDADFSDTRLASELAWNAKPWMEWKLGASVTRGAVEAASLNAKARYWLYGPYVSFSYDTLDSWAFPRQGKLFATSLRFEHENVDDYASAFAPSFEARWKLPFAKQLHHFNWFGEYGSTGSDFVIPTAAQDLGGFLRLSGFQHERLSGRYKALTGLMYFYQLDYYQSPLLQAPIFVGGSLESGGVWNESTNISWNSAVLAGSVFVALDTSVLGPLVLSYGHNQQQQSLYIFIGNDF